MLTTKRKITWDKYFWLFLFASVLGALYEEGLHIVLYYFKHGVFDYSRRSGVLYGPISLVYGIGAVLMLFITRKKEEKWYIVFSKVAILGGVVEFLLSIVQELLTGHTSWDYSDKFLNIAGRTTIPYMLFWGALGVILVKGIYPKIAKLLDSLKGKTYYIVTTVLFILVLVDIAISGLATARANMREKGIEPYTFIGELCDEYFDDEYIEKKYPNAED